MDDVTVICMVVSAFLAGFLLCYILTPSADSVHTKEWTLMIDLLLYAQKHNQVLVIRNKEDGSKYRVTLLEPKSSGLPNND